MGRCESARRAERVERSGSAQAPSAVARLCSGSARVRAARAPRPQVVPLCALVSYTVLTAVAGAPRPEVVPVRVCVLSLLLAMPVGSLRAHERGERSRRPRAAPGSRRS